MDRRTALKFFAISGAAAMLLPGCLTDKKKVSEALKNLDVTADDEELLAELADTIIPATDKPGAKQLNAHIFAFVMVNDCISPADKEKFMRGLRGFNEGVSENGKFLKLAAAQKLEALMAFEKKQDSVGDDIKYFYSKAKGYIIQGYTSSQYYLTEVKPYKLVPGPAYKGCVPLSEKV